MMTTVDKAINLLPLLQAATGTRALRERFHLLWDLPCEGGGSRSQRSWNEKPKAPMTVVFLYEYNACLAPAFSARITSVAAAAARPCDVG